MFRKPKIVLVSFVILLLALIPLSALAAGPGGGGGGGGGGHTETLGNNLSFPVIWSDGYAKVLRGAYGAPILLDQDLWYELVPNVTTCKMTEILGEDYPLCDFGEDPPPEGAVKVWQQHAASTWQAGSMIPPDDPLSEGELVDVNVDWIDWGDNLESVNWYTRSKVRVEVVLFKDLEVGTDFAPMDQFNMRWLSGWGIDELWGTDDVITQGTQATIYSHCGRLTIQYLGTTWDIPANVDEEGWTWNEETHTWSYPDLAEVVPFNSAVWNAGDGPAYFSAETNVKGKVIYGYNWDVAKIGQDPGIYRLTFSLDASCTAGLNTFITDTTKIMVPVEEETATAAPEAEPDDSGGTGGKTYINVDHNLTYIDVLIVDRRGGGGGGGKGGGGGGPPRR